MNEASAESHQWLVGIDWATQEHRVYVMDSSRKPVGERKVEHSGAGIGELASYLDRLCDGQRSRVGIAIETPRGAIVETLLERGYPVYSLNPKQLDRFRDRHTVAGAKDDSRDAMVLADSLRTDAHCFHRVNTGSPWMIRLRELSRTEDEIRIEFGQAASRLREQMTRYFPQLLKLSPAMEDAWVWDLLELARLPVKAAKLQPRQIERILKDNRIRKWIAKDVAGILREQPVQLAPGTAEAASEHSLMLIARLRLLAAQRKQVAGRIQALLDEAMVESAGTPVSQEHRDAAILLSLPGVGRINGATILSEANEAVAARDYDALRAFAGIAPVTRQSGKTKQVLMRKACNPRLRQACYHWGRVCVLHDPRCGEQYKRLRAKGRKHGQALRSVVDRMMLVLIRMLKTGSEFDPSQWNKSAA